jgi:hypothetical protein
MPKVALSVRSLILGAGAVALALPALAESMAEKPMQNAPEAGPPPGFECAAEPVTGSGPGFLSARDKSEDAARADWVKKAQAVYPDATWETAYRSGISCAVQGLYSKCFAEAIPCKPKPGSAEGDTAPDKAAAAPKSE